MDKPTRRVKGNGTPPEDDMPIQYWAPDEPEKTDDGAQDVIDFLLGFTVILVAIVTIMFVYGRFK